MGRPRKIKKGQPAPVFRTLGIRGCEAWVTWIEAAARHDRVTVAGFLDRAAADRAKAIGFDEAPPERLP